MDEEKKKEKKKTDIKTIIILSVIIVALTIVAIFINLPKSEKTEEDKYKDVIKDKSSLEKLNNFINAAMYNDVGNEGVAYDFAKGLNSLTDKQKNILVFNYLVNVETLNEKINEENIPEKYKTDEYIGNFNIVMSFLSSRTFDKEYGKLFGGTPNYDEASLIEMNTCPKVYKFDTRLKKMFLFNECNLEGDKILLTKTYNYKFDDDYYYVYQYVGIMKLKQEGEEKDTFTKVKDEEVVDVESFVGNESKFETLIWKFDKDYNFISTSNSK